MPEAQLHVLERCTLVHEHFHAILETGIGGDSLPARGAGDPSAWERAAPLNEALAAWMELQYVRRYAPWLGTPDESSALQTALWAYIRSGQYPEWPYHGAERIELLFERGGIDAVRNLVLSLRDDPLLALQTFEGIE